MTSPDRCDEVNRSSRLVVVEVVMHPNELLDRLNALLPAQFAELMFRLQMPVHYLSQGAPQTTCAMEALRYFTQSGRLRDLEMHIARGRAEPSAFIKILFLAANPADTTPLVLAEEARSIQQELERSGHRDRFVFETRWAVQPLDILRELRRLKPTVVHFSGYRSSSVPPDAPPSPGGFERGLCFDGGDGRTRLISTTALEQTFAAAGSSVKLVVLTACYSEVQAEALLVHVGCVVGVSGAIEPAAARSFAIGFYGGLGDGESVTAAVKQGQAAISLTSFGADHHPRLKIRDGIEADLLVLASAV